MIPAARPLIGDEERIAVDRVLRSGMIAGGPEVAAFERDFGDQIGRRAGLRRRQLRHRRPAPRLARRRGRAGRRGIVPSFTFAATANAVALTGATPVFADIEPDQFCLDADAVEAAVTERTKGIMPVHLYGHPADMTRLGAVADRHGLAIYEDAAQAHGAAWQGRPVGTFGAFGLFSLYPTKNMTSGEGGMVSCADAPLARSIRLLRNQGMQRRYENEVVGFNARMTDVHAAIGRAQLAKLPGWTQQRQQNAKFLDANLCGVVIPPVADGAVHVYHQYTIRIPDDRDGFARALARRTRRRHRCVLPHPQPSAAVLRARAGSAGNRARRTRGAVAAGASRAVRRRPSGYRHRRQHRRRGRLLI